MHFSRHQVFWDCTEMSACETIPAGLPLPLDQQSAMDRHWRGRLQESTRGTMLLSGVNDDSLDDFWQRSVQSYTSLDLTKQSDKRMAIWGVAKRVRDMLDEDYVAGMWEGALEEQLAWRVANYTAAERPEDLATNPTWSWASMKGTILASERSERRRRSYIVTNHTGEQISFDLGDDSARPGLPRKHSENAADMRRELKLADERRRKSSTTTRQDSQPDLSMLAEDIQAEPESTQASGIFSPRALSPKRKDSEPSRKESTHGLSSQQESQAALDEKREKEPELQDKKIAVNGFLHKGHLKRIDSSGIWSLEIQNLASNRAEIDAFPDLSPVADDLAVTFVVLALTQLSDQASLEGSNREIWYEGHGLMLQEAKEELCYRRIGALRIRHLNHQLWQYLQTTNSSPQDTTDNPKAIPGTKFFLE